MDAVEQNVIDLVTRSVSEDGPQTGRRFYIRDNMCTPYKLILAKCAGYLEANGWVQSNDPADCDTVMTGTCAAFHSLEQESIDTYHESRAKAPDASHLVFGCLPRINPDKTEALGADQIIASTEWERLESLVDMPAVRLSEIPESNDFRMSEEYRVYDEGKKFVLLQTGCTYNCPFCPHKMGIGEMKSRCREDVVNQVRELSADPKIHTIVLTGNDAGAWGSDIGSDFPSLVEEVLEIAPAIHICQVNPQWAFRYRDRLFELLQNPKIKDFQVLIQSASNRVLKMMERAPVVGKLEPFLRDLRQSRPDLHMRTDIMVGYPGATDDEEQQTLDYVHTHFDEVAVHAFEIFPHARIATMDLDFLPQEEVLRRVERGLNYLSRFPDLLVHRGGQVYETLIEADKSKAAQAEKACG